MRFMHALLLALLGVAACEDVPLEPEPGPPLARGDPERQWHFGWTDVGASSPSLTPLREQTGGIVSGAHDHGPLAFLPAGTGPDATGEVYSDASGSTFWASTEAPSTPLAGSAYASSVDLHQVIWFRKTAEDADLQFLVTGIQLEAVDGNGGPPTALECPWLTDGSSIEECRRAMWSTASFHVTGWAPEATDVTDGYPCGTSQCFLQAHGFAGLAGWSSDWKLEVYALEGLEAVWDTADFDFRADVDGNGGTHAQVRLRGPIAIKVPVDRVAVGGVFAVRATVFVDASNRQIGRAHV